MAAPRKVQFARRAVQISVVCFMLAVPAIARYANYLSAREIDPLMEKWEGTTPGAALTTIDAVLRALPDAEIERAGTEQRNRTRVLEYTQLLRGGPWSAEVAGVSFTDPLAAAESAAASWNVPWVLLTGLFVPLLATILLGRVFCSWICPMGLFLEATDRLRGVLRFLEIHPRHLRASRRIKYALLVCGLLVAAAASMPILGYVYPPAVINRELHDLVFGIFDRAEHGRFGLWPGAFSWMALFLLAIALFEVTVSRRWWCRYVCPGGALYSLLGWARPVRVKLRQESCTGCARCTAVCPMGLNPMKDEMGMECDNCGVCIPACADAALDYGIDTPLLARGARPPARGGVWLGGLLGVLCLLTPSPSLGHHILGIPHYAYDEQYPQTPVLTYRVDAGRYEVKMTGFPGKPAPGERCSLHVYVRDRDSGALFDDVVRLTVMEDRLIGTDPVIYGPLEVTLEEAVYKFYPRFPTEANYLVRIEFQIDETPWTIDLPMVVGEPGSPWAVLATVAIGTAVFLLVVRAVRIKRRRRANRERAGAAGTRAIRGFGMQGRGS